MNELKEKLYKNSLILEKITKLDKFERQKVIMELLKDKSERDLGEELGIPHSTIHDWKSLRQSNLARVYNISFSAFYRKICELDPKKITDWGRLEQIKNKLEELLKRK